MADGYRLQRLAGVALVAVGGFAGSNLRYLVDTLAPGPGGTLLVNVAGSFALGVLLYEAVHTDLLDGRTRLVLGSGFLSSFTTYSTFALEAFEAAPVVATGYVTASYGLGFAAVLAGRAVAVRLEASVDAAGAADGGDSR